MAGNLDDFLKRAQERRRQKQQQGAQQPPPPRNPPPPPPTQRRPSPPPTPAPQPRPAPPAFQPQPLAEPDIIIAEEAHEPLHSHIDTSDFEDRASHMAEEVALADDHMDEHIHEVFDHDLGRLNESAEQKKARDAAKAHPIMKMLATKTGVQQAVIMAEILQRPAFLRD